MNEFAKIGNGVKAAIVFTEAVLGPGNGNRKLHVAVAIVKALAEVSSATGLVPEGAAGDILQITELVNKTVSDMKVTGELPDSSALKVVPKPQTAAQIQQHNSGNSSSNQETIQELAQEKTNLQKLIEKIQGQ